MQPLAFLILLASISVERAIGFVPGSDNWAQQGFYFDWNNASSPLPTSITGQCESINIKWYRGTGTGPDPVAPFFLKIYSSSFTHPFLINAGNGLETKLPIPFDPQSRYVICMTDSLGTSGGCQDLYTVYTGNTSCPNFTTPDNFLGVKMTSIDTGGSLSRYGWPASCSDLQFDVVNEGGVVGTPPYTLTVAPAFRTPVNISFDKIARWTVTLDHGHPFFVSVSDSQGIMWSNGPLHAGAGSPTCLSPPPPHAWLTLSASLGMSFSFLVLGIILASLCAWFIAFRRPVQFASAVTDEPRNLETTNAHEHKTNSSPHQDDPRVSRVEGRRRGTTSAPVPERGVASGNLFGGLNLRRPPNTRATSSEMTLLSRRPTVRREDTQGSLDLAASPTEDVQRPFKFGPEASRRSEGAGTIIPWTSANATQQPAAEVPLATTPPTSYQKGHFFSNSASSGSNPNASSGSNPNAAGTSTSAVRSPPAHSAPSGHVPNIATPQPQSYHHHHGSFSSNGSRPSTLPPLNAMSPQLQPHEVYVVHHDAGLPPPVTVFAVPGTRVTELPPGYEHILATTPRPEGETLLPTDSRTAGDGTSRGMPKQSLSPPSIARSPLQTQGSTANPGMVLVNAEDLPQSASSPSGSTFSASLPERGS